VKYPTPWEIQDVNGALMIRCADGAVIAEAFGAEQAQTICNLANGRHLDNIAAADHDIGAATTAAPMMIGTRVVVAGAIRPQYFKGMTGVAGAVRGNKIEVKLDPECLAREPRAQRYTTAIGVVRFPTNCVMPIGGT